MVIKPSASLSPSGNLISYLALLTIFTGYVPRGRSDFQVILPEVCKHPDLFNLTWIESMVLLGIREEKAHHSLHILENKDVCDGSDGLLKLISNTQSQSPHYSSRTIASLPQSLCPTAATFSRANKRELISWTCPQIPGVLSMKPRLDEVIIAVQRMLNYTGWTAVAITKYKLDRSPFCDDVGAGLMKGINEITTTTALSVGESSPHRNSNKHLPPSPPPLSVVMLGNYEDLKQNRALSLTKLDGIFLCVSYEYGFSHNFSMGGSEGGSGGESSSGESNREPTALLPEWPLPVEFFSPGNPTLALVAGRNPTQVASSFDFQQKNWDPMHTSSSSHYGGRPHKLLETLLAQMIVRSVKLSLDVDRRAQEGLTNEVVATEEESLLPSPSVVTKSNRDHLIRHTNDDKWEKYNNEGDSGTQHYPNQQFLFSILQFEKARWHPLINLVNVEARSTGSLLWARTSSRRKTAGVKGDKSVLRSGGGSGSSGETRSSIGTFTRGTTSTAENDISLDEDSLLTWFQILVGMVLMGLVTLGGTLMAIYARKKSRKRDFSSAKHCRKLSRRHRIPGTHTSKLILTSEDLSFGPSTTGSETGKKGSKTPFIGTLSPFQRYSGGGSQEKSELLKGSFAIATIRKQSGPGALGGMANSAIETNVMRYKGDMVYIKKLSPRLSSSDSFEVNAKSILVLETIHGLRHENLVALVGFYANTLSRGEVVPSLVWELCSRGSLHDIIKQSEIKLDWAFKLSLLTDLVRGMRYLHSSLIKVHGFLTSHNCVIDARWVLKITDFGLPAFCYTEGIPLRQRSAKELLWTAPELLRDEALRNQGTQAGDVYSFAIIMQEVLVRGEPFGMLTLTAEEILEKVKKPPPLIRPSVSKGAAPPEAINIMRQCWAELPDMRPDFMVIHDLFKTLNHGRKANIVDTMFQMLEKYSNNLEELIRERTEQLDLERKKTEQLLNRMLPNTVAEKLKLGLPVDPEEFSEVTIYFSDIVGFTTISAYSTPFEVVDLLNDLYTCFDATINDYNVYKVETIGDAYMVVGGAPLSSPDHADQIATMALDLLHQSGRFKIRHLPFTDLRLRIGLHTGSCCAGVVGLTMPRYCLFGDTVNTASRMESTGAPWRIHVSTETKDKLDERGGYIIEPRGMTDIKGKGPMPTYWLLGKEGFDKELPTPPPLNECKRLDENAIKYGRSGVWPNGSEEKLTATTENVDRGSTISPRHLLAPPKSPSSFALLQNGGMRPLSPAEQIAHQLLNGRPTTKGLRRQLSLDPRVMPNMLHAARRANKAKGPSGIKRSPSLRVPSVAGNLAGFTQDSSNSRNIFFSSTTDNNYTPLGTVPVISISTNNDPNPSDSLDPNNGFVVEMLSPTSPIPMFSSSNASPTFIPTSREPLQSEKDGGESERVYEKSGSENECEGVYEEDEEREIMIVGSESEGGESQGKVVEPGISSFPTNESSRLVVLNETSGKARESLAGKSMTRDVKKVGESSPNEAQAIENVTDARKNSNSKSSKLMKALSVVKEATIDSQDSGSGESPTASSSGSKFEIVISEQV